MRRCSRSLRASSRKSPIKMQLDSAIEGVTSALIYFCRVGALHYLGACRMGGPQRVTGRWVQSWRLNCLLLAA
jgi:hypothetical protein